MVFLKPALRVTSVCGDIINVEMAGVHAVHRSNLVPACTKDGDVDFESSVPACLKEGDLVSHSIAGVGRIKSITTHHSFQILRGDGSLYWCDSSNSSYPRPATAIETACWKFDSAKAEVARIERRLADCGLEIAEEIAMNEQKMQSLLAKQEKLIAEKRELLQQD